MTREQFNRYLSLSQFLSDRCHTLYQNSVDLIEYDEDFHKVINILGIEAFTPHGWQHVNEFSLEDEYTREKPMCWDSKTNEPLYWDADSLYDYLVREKYIRIK